MIPRPFLITEAPLMHPWPHKCYHFVFHTYMYTFLKLNNDIPLNVSDPELPHLVQDLEYQKMTPEWKTGVGQ